MPAQKAPLIERAREAFAAYRGLGKDIIDELIFALEVANREVERLKDELTEWDETER